jgi:PAS domain S-box-containing protein
MGCLGALERDLARVARETIAALRRAGERPPGEAALRRLIRSLFTAPEPPAGRALPQGPLVHALWHLRAPLEAALTRASAGRPKLARRRLHALARRLEREVAAIASACDEAEACRDLVDSAVDMIWQVGPDGRFQRANRAVFQRLGYAPEHLFSRRLVDLVAPEDRESAERHLRRVFESGESRAELTLIAADGSAVYVEVASSGKRAPGSGAVVRTRGYVRDVTERRLAEQAARREQENARLYLEVAAAAFVVLDPDGRTRLVNRRMCEVLGREEKEIVGRDWFASFVGPGDRARTLAYFQDLVADRVRPIDGFVNTVARPDGEERRIEWHAALIRDEAGRIVACVGSGVDVTERARLQEQLLERESLARMGEMAAVVAHEVRNPLAGISGALQGIARQLPPESPHQPVIKEILARVTGLDATVKELLVFARPRAPRLAAVPILTLVRGTAALFLQSTEAARIDFALDGEDVLVSGDRDQLHLVFLNLITNAAQAMDGAGPVRVRAERAGPRCRIAVRDRGHGIAPAVRPRLFQPFFTTKARGTGLGLALAKRIVDAHGGSIRADSPPDGGTEIVVELPVHAAPADAGPR